MTPIIQNLITACEWSTSHFFIISDNVFSPLLYYSYFGAVIPSVIIALFVFLKDPKKLINRLLLLTVLSFTVWVLCALVTWATEFPSYTMFSWSLLVLFEPLVYFFAFYFFYVFIFEKDFSILQKILFSLPLLITFVLTPTSFGLLGYDISNCDRAAVEGIVATYGYIIELVYMFFILGFAFYFINKTKDFLLRRKAILLTTGVVLFLLSFSAGNILEVFTENWYIGQYGLFGAPIFVGFLAYLIVKFKTFNIKIIGTQVLVLGLGFLVLTILFIRNIQDVRFVVIFTLIFVIILGYNLIRSVKKEVKQREKLEALRLKLEESNLNLEVANDKLKSLDKLKTEFVSLASHQLRSPLTAIKGYASMLVEGDYGEIQGETKEAVSRIFQSCQNLTRVVEDLLDVTKIEQGGMKFVMETFNLVEIARDMAKDLSITAEGKGLKLNFSSDDDVCMVNGDKEKIRQVVLNFIDNSIKYTKVGEINVSVKKIGDKALFSVKDTGVGMTEAIKVTLFQKFVRGDGGQMNTTGSGLGLYLAKEIVEAHNGRVWVDSEGVNKGSEFYMELDIIK